MDLDLRIVFLVFLFLTAILHRLRFGAVVSLGDVWQVIMGTLWLLAVFGTVGTFIQLLTRSDPLPMLRQAAYQLSLQHLVSFEAATPPRLEGSQEVTRIERQDTDGDGFREWVVFYRFDTDGAPNPIHAVIYDNDRGNPPVIFPYSLRAPDRNYLSEGAVSLRLEPVTTDRNGPGDEDLDEILVDGTTTLTIFRFRENSEEWDFPRDVPVRYEPIGFFRGSGGVIFDEVSKRVTVQDRNGYERSQLAIRSVYALNPATNSYVDTFDPNKLAAPVFATVDFFSGPPADILNTAFPEKIVLALYTAACGDQNEMLCRSANPDWQAQDFLAPNSDAMAEFQNGNPGYFGLPAFSGVQDIAVTHLRYYPALETDPDLLVTGGGRDVVTGEEAQANVVDIMFVVNGGPVQTARYAMGLVEGQWKILQRLPVDTPVLATPGQ